MCIHCVSALSIIKILIPSIPEMTRRLFLAHVKLRLRFLGSDAEKCGSELSSEINVKL